MLITQEGLRRLFRRTAITVSAPGVYHHVSAKVRAENDCLSPFTVATIHPTELLRRRFSTALLRTLQQRLPRPVFARAAFVALLATFVLVQTPNMVSDAQRRRPRRTPRAASVSIDTSKYSTLTHHTHGPDGQDARAKLLKCSDCHTVPSAGEAIVAVDAKLADPLKRHPYHDNCFGCHEREIYRGARPAICSVCHSRVSPRATSRDIYEWKFITANFNHLGGGANRRHVAECESCHKADAETARVKFPDAPIAACFQCHKSNKPRIVTEIDVYQEVLEGRAQGTPECTGCHVAQIGRQVPPCSHYLLFGEDYFSVEDFPKTGKQLEARCKK